MFRYHKHMTLKKTSLFPSLGSILALSSLLGPIAIPQQHRNLRLRRQILQRTSLGVPYAVFRVSRGKRYRFRLVGGTCTVCPSQVSVESHSLLLIATDGNPIEPVRVDSIVLYPGKCIYTGRKISVSLSYVTIRGEG